MRLELAPLPEYLPRHDLRGRVVVVFDVLRATTSIAAALAAGAAEIRIFPSLEAAQLAAEGFEGPKLLCGESNCLPPPGFDLGNSPGRFVPEVCRGQTLFMATTNGTRALVAASRAEILLAGALVNAGAIARELARLNRDILLLCAGTDGQIATEDLLGAGAVASQLHAISNALHPSDDVRIAMQDFQSQQRDLISALRGSQGGRNIIQAGLDEDILFAGKLNSIDILPLCDSRTLTIRAVA